MSDIHPLEGYDIQHKVGLTNLGFRLLPPWGEILHYGLPREEYLNNTGVYAVLRLDTREPNFYRPENVQQKRNVINPFQPEELSLRWVPGVQVLYFGAAGLRSYRSLRKRLGDLRRHALGKTSTSGPHRGGEILWQVQGYDNFEIMAMPTDGPPIPRKWESALIKQFVRLTEKKPFANRVD